MPTTTEFSVTCPTCGAGPREHCRARPSGRPARWPHVARYEAQYPRCRNCGLMEKTHPVDVCQTFRPPLPRPSFAVGYHIVDQSWHHPITSKVLGNGTDEGANATRIMVGMYSTTGTGACQWEFAVAEPTPSTISVRVFNDAWDAFADIPDFFSGLSDLGASADVGSVIILMERLGFEDMTQRTR